MNTKNNPLLPVLSFCANDAILAEHLLDFIYLLNRRKPRDYCLLVSAADAHAELDARVKIAAEVAFKYVDFVKAPAVAGYNPYQRINYQFRAAAAYVAKTYRLPWLWLEPDAVPLRTSWLEAIALAHYQQPKRYSGSWLKSRDLFLARIAVYPPDAFSDLETFFTGPDPFNWSAGSTVIPKSTKTRLVQETVYTEGMAIAETAVLLHHDKNAVKLTELRDQLDTSVVF